MKISTMLWPYFWGFTGQSDYLEQNFPARLYEKVVTEYRFDLLYKTNPATIYLDHYFINISFFQQAV